LRVPLAPPAEQLRLVEAIDSYLSRLDAAVASLEAAQHKLKAYRASVLKAAVEGRLVATEAALARKEGRPYEPADALLGRILKERRHRWEESELAKMKATGRAQKDDRWKAKYEEPVPPDTSKLPGLSEGWCWSTLDQLIVEPLANGKSVPDGPGFSVLRLTAIKAGRVDLAQRKTGNWADVDPRGYVLKSGDLLIVRGNGSIHLVGRAGLVTKDADDVAYPDTLIRARVGSNALLHELLAYLWDAPSVRTHLEGRAKTTAGIHKVNQTDLGETPLPLPPLAEQARILEEIDRLLSVSNATSEQVAFASARAERLRQAVLKWAFEGKLVDQDSTDEPAHVLLGRIRAERSAIAPARTKAKRARKLKAAS
jgi:type I restriction enzyme S subunit